MTEGYQSYKKEPEHNNVLGFLHHSAFTITLALTGGSTPGAGDRRERGISRERTDSTHSSQPRHFYHSQFSHTDIDKDGQP